MGIPDGKYFLSKCYLGPDNRERRFHQYHIPGVPQANFARAAANASGWLPHGRAAPGVVLDGVQLYTLAGSPGLDNVVVLEFDMAIMPTLQNQLTYFGHRATRRARSCSTSRCFRPAAARRAFVGRLSDVGRGRQRAGSTLRGRRPVGRLSDARPEHQRTVK